MKLKETIKNHIDELNFDELLILYQQIILFKKVKSVPKKVLSLEEINTLTASSKSNWADEVINEREETD